MNKTVKNIVFFSLLPLLFAALSEYFLEIAASILLFDLIIYFFLQEKTPPVILFGTLFQWLSIAVGYLYLSITSESPEVLLWRPEYSLQNLNTAFWQSILGLLVFCIGIKTALLRHRRTQPEAQEIEQYNTTRVIIFYIFFAAGSDFLFRAVRFVIPGLAQPIHILGYLKWSLLFIMVYISFKKNEKKKIVIFILIIEILIGFTGYFSAFKEIMILLPAVFLSFQKLNAKQSLIILGTGILLFNIGILWSYVKGEYRMFLSGGERAQVVRVKKIEALKKLYELSSELNEKSYQMGLEALIKRIFSLEYYSATINHIPERVPYMEGENWNNALKHIFMPRILFPDKKAIDDSKQTSKLTGIYVADAEKGTSISVGYMAEAYADFGSFFMHFPIFILGLILGKIYSYFSGRAPGRLWAYALTFPMYFLFNINGRNIIKIAGDTFMFLIVFFLLLHFLLPYIDSFLKKK